MAAVVLTIASAGAAHGQVPRVPAELFPIQAPVSPSTGTESKDGLPAYMTQMAIHDFAVAPDGSLLAVDSSELAGSGLIRSIGMDGMVRDVAGASTQRLRPSDTPALNVRLPYAKGVEALGDGSVLVLTADDGLHRIWPDQRVTTVPTDAPVPGDGLAVLPDGRILVQQTQVSGDGAIIIRQVGPDGHVSRFAGNGDYGKSGDGGPATQAQLGDDDGGISGFEAMPDGSVLIADAGNDRVRRVDAAGIIHTAAEVPRPTDVAAAPDGGFYVSSSIDVPIAPGSEGFYPLPWLGMGWFVLRYAPDGSLQHVIEAPRTEPSSLVAQPFGAASFAVLPDGNLVITGRSSFGALSLVALTRGERLAAAIRSMHVRGGAVTVKVAATAAGTATLTADSRNGPVSQSAPVVEGMNDIVLTGPFPWAKRLVRLEVADASGRVAGDRVVVSIGGGLHKHEAQQWLRSVPSLSGRPGPCLRVAARRVDCPDGFRSGPERRFLCAQVGIVRLKRTGMPRHRFVRCDDPRSPLHRQYADESAQVPAPG